MRLCRGEKGSATVFVVSVLSVVILGIAVIMAIVKEKADKGKIEDSLVISSRSVLSEYNPYVKNRYGIFMLNRDTNRIKEGLRFYLKENMGRELKGEYEIFTNELSCHIPDNLEKNIMDYCRATFAKTFIKKRNNEKREGNRTLKNRYINELLPWGEDESSFADVKGIFEGMKKMDDIFNGTFKRVALDGYILNKFNSYVSDDGETFFKNEIEYILSGSKSDEVNQRRFVRKLILLRNLANIAFIESSPDMKSKITAAAAATGPFAGLSYLGILEAWALAESINDVKILENGGKIPIAKNARTWAVDIESVLADKEKDGYIDNKSDTGMDYDDYLRLFLFFTSKDKKLKRMMNLMQINTQGIYDESFTLTNSTFGFRYFINIDGREYSGKEFY